MDKDDLDESMIMEKMRETWNLKVQRKKKDAATLFMWDLKNEKWKA